MNAALNYFLISNAIATAILTTTIMTKNTNIHQSILS